jgi:hypothetical protein
MYNVLKPEQWGLHTNKARSRTCSRRLDSAGCGRLINYVLLYPFEDPERQCALKFPTETVQALYWFAA